MIAPFLAYWQIGVSRQRLSTFHTPIMPLASPVSSRLPSGLQVSIVMGAAWISVSSCGMAVSLQTDTAPSFQPIASTLFFGCHWMCVASLGRVTSMPGSCRSPSSLNT